MGRKYFGTDGIRGKVGQKPITPDFVLKLGWAAGRILGANPDPKRSRGLVLIGKDTRISGYMFEAVLEAGLSAAGIDTKLLGPMPTPAIAYLTRTLHAIGGIVISASHNPYDDNGIKFFSGNGQKLPDEVEEAIEAEMEKPMETVGSDRLGKAKRMEDAGGRYIEFCKSTIPNHVRLDGLRIVVDCANGATYSVAPCVFTELGAEVIPLGTQPDGVNINADCGAVYPANLQKAVLEHKADLGIALDGDGDRLIMVDHLGQVVDGDEILYIIAKSRKKRLGSTVVGTVMTNLGLEHALAEQGVALARSSVGDRYVLELMQKGGWLLGGETSGHIICMDYTTTGDGVISALQVLRAMQESEMGLAEIKQGMQKYPQELINVRVERKADPMACDPVRAAVDQVTRELSGSGRVLLRTSGTEPVIRVMVEGREREKVSQAADYLAAVVKEHLC